MSEDTLRAAAPDWTQPHDPGCHCWPHWSREAIDAARVEGATEEYRAGKRALASSRPEPLDVEPWPDRAWLVSHWVNHRCGYVDCRATEMHEHGGGEPMREMTPDERAEYDRLGDKG